MSLDGLQAESDKAVTHLGSMLFTRQVSGARYENLKREWQKSGLEGKQGGVKNQGLILSSQIKRGGGRV